MRQRFEQQLRVGSLLIEDTVVSSGRRVGATGRVCAALKELFINKTYNEKVFSLLEDRLLSGKKKTGRPGMDLWQIFVLSQVRLSKNISYDELLHIANHDYMIRHLMGIETSNGFNRIQYSYQNIVDNVKLLDDEIVKELNDLIVEFAHDTFKKKRCGSLLLLKQIAL